MASTAASQHQDQKPFELAIIGAGISGVTLAIALNKRGIKCTIYEQAQTRGSSDPVTTVSLNRNAIQAMEFIDRSMLGAFNIVATRNKWDTKKSVWFDFLDGMSQQPAGTLKPLFSVEDPNVGQVVVNRARFLAELVHLLPNDGIQFEKKLIHVLDDRIGSGKVLMKFEDGSVAEADGIIGCDGIKSRTREIVVGRDHPAAQPLYTHKYAYRGLIPMDDAIQILGEERAVNSSLWMGQNRHVLTFPVDRGTTISMTAFATNDRENWPSQNKLVLPTTKAEALDDFREFGQNVKNIIQLADDNLDRWGIFDLGKHPLSKYYKARICLIGDAAHAASPHHGAGVGFCIEDAALLAHLLADAQVKGLPHLEVAFAIYDEHRRERTQWLVSSSRRAGDLYEWLTADVGADVPKLAREVHERLSHVWNYDLADALREATKALYRRLALPGIQKWDSQKMPFVTNEQDGVETQ